VLRSALAFLSLVTALLAGTLITRADAAEIDLRQECPDLRADEVFRKEPAYGPSGEVIARFVGFTEFRRSAALVIGVGTYDKLTRLEAPTVDADRVRGFLIDGAGFDYVVTLKDGRANLDLIRCLMDTAFPTLLGPNDRFLFYFSGHGMERQIGGRTIGYLPLKSSNPTAYHTMIGMDLVEQWSGFLANTRHTLFVLDACFSGLAGQQWKSDEITLKRLELLKGPSHYLITAGSAKQESVASLKRWGGSLFTTALLEAASGKGDFGTPDGVVSLKEMLKYVEDRIVAETVRDTRIRMSPQMSVLQANEGEFFFLAREHLNRRAGNLPETKLARGEPAQTKAAQASVQVELEPVERPGSLTSRTNVRSRPSSNSSQVTALERGVQIYVAGQVRGQPWYLVERDGEPLGYVLARNVALEADKSTKPAETSTRGQPAAPPLFLEGFDQIKSDQIKSGRAQLQTHADFQGSFEHGSIFDSEIRPLDELDEIAGQGFDFSSGRVVNSDLGEGDIILESKKDQDGRLSPSESFGYIKMPSFDFESGILEITDIAKECPTYGYSNAVYLYELHESKPYPTYCIRTKEKHFAKMKITKYDIDRHAASFLGRPIIIEFDWFYQPNGTNKF
jgi:hypothetical protein